MEVFQEMIRQQKVTEDIRQVQRNSLVTTVMATATVFLLVIDFAVVVKLLKHVVYAFHQFVVVVIDPLHPEIQQRLKSVVPFIIGHIQE